MAGIIAAKMPEDPTKSAPAADGSGIPGAPTGSAATTGGSTGPAQATTQGATAPSYDPERIQLDPNTDTVEGRLNSIIDKNSPLQQSAATAAQQQMASRGLVNSSMAVGAGQKAVIDSALPIATSDAAAMQGMKTTNAAAGNAALSLGAQNLNAQQLQSQQGDIQSKLQAERGDIEMKLQTADAASKADLMARQGEIDKQLSAMRADLDLRNQTQLKAIDANLAVQLENIKGQYSQVISASQSASNLYAATSQNIANILANPKLSTANKQAAITQETKLLQNGMSVIANSSGVDFGNLLDFSTLPAMPTTTTKGGGGIGQIFDNVRSTVPPP